VETGKGDLKKFGGGAGLFGPKTGRKAMGGGGRTGTQKGWVGEGGVFAEGAAAAPSRRGGGGLGSARGKTLWNGDWEE